MNHPTNLAQLFFLFSEISTDDVDIETIDNDEKLLTYRPDVEVKSIGSYRNSKLPRDPEMWEDNINMYVFNFQYHYNNPESLNTYFSTA